MTLTPTTKKILGLAIVIPIVLVQLLVLSVMLVDTYFNKPLPKQDIATTIFLVCMIGLPAWWGYSLWQAGKIESSPIAKGPSPFQVAGKKSITVQSKVDLPQYRRLTFLLTYTKPNIIFINIMGPITPFFLGTDDWLGYGIGLLMIILPFRVYHMATQAHRSNKILNEFVTYNFSASGFTATGTSSHLSLRWSELYTIKERKNWLLLYLNKQALIPIPKAAFASPEDIDIIRQMRYHLRK